MFGLSPWVWAQFVEISRFPPISAGRGRGGGRVEKDVGMGGGGMQGLSEKRKNKDNKLKELVKCFVLLVSGEKV